MVGLDQEPGSRYMEPWDCPVCPRVRGIWCPTVSFSLSVHWPFLHFYTGGGVPSRSPGVFGDERSGCSRGGHISSLPVCVSVCPDLVTSGWFEPEGSHESLLTLKPWENGS